MPKKKLLYELTSPTWGPEERAAIERVVRHGGLTMGEEVRKFESAFAKKVGVKHAVMTTSGSAANLLAVASLCFKKERPVKRGDEAIVPAISWATTYTPLQQYGLKMRFVDVELDTLNIDVSLLERALTPRTRLVVGVSVLGNPCALDKIRAFCDRHGLYFLEDNCESLGAELRGRPCGTFGDIGTFSLYYSHHLSTGEGGVLVTRNKELYQLAYSLRNHGQTRGLPPSTSFFKRRPDDFYEAYRFVLPGYNAKPGEIAGAAGSEQLKKLPKMIKWRRRNAALFVELFGKDPRVIIQRENGKASWFAFTLVLHPRFPMERRTLLAALRKAGIEHRIVTGGCFPRHDAIKYCDHSFAVPLKNGDLIHDRGFFVGNHPRDLSRELQRFHEVFVKTCGRAAL